MSKNSFVTDCPRCGSRSFEHLREYAHCPGCLYFEDHYEDTETCYSAVRSMEIGHMKPFRGDEEEVEENDEFEQLAS